MDIHGSSTSEETIEAIRIVKDYIINASGVQNIQITKGLLASCSSASAKYKAFLDAKREQERKEEEARQEELLNKQKEEELRSQETKHAMEIGHLEAAISVAEEKIFQGNSDLKRCFQSTTLDRKKLELAQAKIDMGVKRKAKLSSELQELKKKVPKNR